MDRPNFERAARRVSRRVHVGRRTGSGAPRIRARVVELDADGERQAVWV